MMVIAVFGSSHPHQRKKEKNTRCQSWNPLTKFSGSAHGLEPAASRSRVNHSTNEPLRSLGEARTIKYVRTAMGKRNWDESWPRGDRGWLMQGQVDAVGIK